KPDIIALEATDIDYISSFDFKYNNIPETPLSTTSKSHSDITSIADEFRSTSQTPNKRRRSTHTSTSQAMCPPLPVTSQKLNSFDANTEITSSGKGKKKLSDLALDSLNLGLESVENWVEIETKWVEFDDSECYDLLRAFSHLSLTRHPNKPTHIAVCASCKTTAKRRSAPLLSPIPEELANVPMYYRRWLSPIHLSCSLGRAERANQFTHYRHLTGEFERNIIRADLPDPQSESVLYNLVRTHQIHRCRPDKCNGPPLPGEQCHKKFPAPLSNCTYFDPSSL
ncbi:11366_t:CDS:2, partial [Racocetra fulgida]